MERTVEFERIAFELDLTLSQAKNFAFEERIDDEHPFRASKPKLFAYLVS